MDARRRYFTTLVIGAFSTMCASRTVSLPFFASAVVWSSFTSRTVDTRHVLTTRLAAYAAAVSAINAVSTSAIFRVMLASLAVSRKYAAAHDAVCRMRVREPARDGLRHPAPARGRRNGVLRARHA